ncbi:hypothetical protein CLV51_11029 [Chitinophaga niastensis]|uniref:Uncharacterized protein n=1 Tax=Chitinophaga niastensis TaxID=536980 RepID=A0A2P8H9A5_CHINA|nr:hypothetical protein [Chitinophaga niastensis]PSL42813.1 hypothetical protein CLV51_11029 [Chitinophaga niastensis]
MENFALKCFNVSAPGKSAAFYLLSRGKNTGRPAFEPYRNSYAFFCSSAETEKYYWCVYALWKSGCFRPMLHGTVIEFIGVGELYTIISTAIGAFRDVDKLIARLRTIYQLEISYREKLRLLELLQQSLLHQS